MVNNNQEHIRKIREDFQASQRVKDSLNNSIQTLAKDLYSKETHFIFELIQNAEDNTYKELEPSLCFRLAKTDPTCTQNSDGALIIQNNEIGFSPENVDAICAIGKTTKTKIQGYIGEKGIGFKSVFRVTSTPYIFSNNYRFCLPEHDEETGLGYIVPRWVDILPEGIALLQTTIILPLDKAGYGYTQVEEMLREIDPETILFLSKLKEIQIETETGDSLTILKDDSKTPQVQILVEGEKKGEFFSEVNEFLLYSQAFAKPEDINEEKRIGIDERAVSIAFPLDEGKKGVGKIFAYLPVRFDTGLPFLINADFILTSSREDIQREVPWNRWLMKCVANLVADALPRLKERELLTVMLLENLASSLHDLDGNHIFFPIVEAVRNALMDLDLLPADDGTFVSARNAKLASAERLRKLLRERHLLELFKTNQPLKWLSGDISERGTSDLWKFIRVQLKVEEVTPDSFARKIDETFLSNRSDDWLISFYRYIATQKALWKTGSGYWNPPGPLRNRAIIKLQDGSFVKPFDGDKSPNAYLAAEMDAETSLPIVKKEISKDEEVRQFLKELGIPELDIVAEVIEIILPKYPTALQIPIDEHKRDIDKIERAYSTDSQEKKQRLKEKLKTTDFIKAYNPTLKKIAYRQPSQIYFRNADLELYFSGNREIWFVNDLYGNSVKQLFNELGVANKIRIIRRDINDQGHVIIYSQHGNHERGLDKFDPDIKVGGLEYAISQPTSERSLFIWNRLAIPNLDCIRGTVERSSHKTYDISKKDQRVSEKFGRLLIDTAWLPSPDGEFRRPSELFLDDLPESFSRNEKLAEQLGMKKNIISKLAEEAGIPAEDIELLKKHPEEFQKWKATIAANKEKQTFPIKQVYDTERRREKLLKQLNDASIKEYKPLKRSVRITEATGHTRVWLKNQYTKEDNDQMICQICREEMPFKKRDGEYYFEAVEAFSKNYCPKEHEAQFLALCPLCAAMYKEFVKNDGCAMETFKYELMNSKKPEIPLRLGELDTSVRFVETHYHDIKTILSYQED